MCWVHAIFNNPYVILIDSYPFSNPNLMAQETLYNLVPGYRAESLACVIDMCHW